MQKGEKCMAEAKQDLRVKKTQRLLAVAMFTLLEKQNFGKITVNDICTEAMVSRSAFYSHFEDKYALLRFCMVVLKERMFENTQGMDVRTHLRCVLEKILEHVKIVRNLFLSEFDTELMEMMRQAFHEDFERLLRDFNVASELLPGSPELLSVYYASGMTSVVRFWISQNNAYTIDEVTDCLCALMPRAMLERRR